MEVPLVTRARRFRIYVDDACLAWGQEGGGMVGGGGKGIQVQEE